MLFPLPSVTFSQTSLDNMVSERKIGLSKNKTDHKNEGQTAVDSI